MSFHRPSIIRYGSWVGDCIDLLGSPSSVHIGDRRLAAWAQLQALAEENLTMAGLNEGSSINSSDPRTLFVLKNGYERAKTWRKHLPSDIMMETLDIHYHVILLNLCQPGLYSSHKSRDFRPPYAISVYDAPEGSAQESLQLVHARMECMHIARTLINLFLNLSAEELRQVPVVVFTRMMYAVVVLTKAEKSFSLSGAASNNGNSESISTTDLLHCILSRLSSAADGCQYRNPAIFFAVLRRLLCSIGDGSPQLLSTQDQVIEPLMNLAISQARHDISVEQDNYPPVESRAFDLESMFSSKQTDPFFVPPFPLDDAMHPIPGNASTDATAIMLWNSILGDEAFP
ncbi:hypothetical protein QQS21_008726 [Conoideocrella luteorostrata]|uniref:Transcription factor domain-containing protein n=1 Tax=Conoideocrella luteorostrata TaxID=1105319 RepID=A0AAJ0CIA8_9HYPO|nr:hypothetical protein QQS21_008726 [Conoideocrella luteorostrata]